MAYIVITGSTRGIGFGLAEAFLARDQAVVISGRSQQAVEQAAARLEERFPQERILGFPCDVTDIGALQALWAAAVARFGRVDIWINNAGITNPRVPLWQQSPEMIAAVVDTNLKGTMYGCRVAAAGMLAQGGGFIYNMEGLGSDGRMVPGLALYGSTKSGLAYFTKALVAETRDTSVGVGSLSPGMVVTDLLLEEDGSNRPDWERSQRALNILADRVETVTPWLADKILANQQHGARIRWLTTAKIFGRFLTAPFVRRQVLP